MKAMKGMALAGLLVMAGVVSAAQTVPSTTEEAIQGILDDFSQMSEYYFSVTGTSVDSRGVTKNLQEEFAVSIVPTVGTSEKVLLEHRLFEEGNLVSRSVGDGLILWQYDAKSHTYRSTYYGETSMAGSIERLTQTLRSRISGPSLALVQLLNLSLNVPNSSVATQAARWKPLHATATASFDPDLQSILCTFPKVSAEMSYNYGLENGVTPYLSTITYSGNRTIGTGAETLDWTATLTRDTLMPGADFTFNPGTARLVSGTYRQ